MRLTTLAILTLLAQPQLVHATEPPPALAQGELQPAVPIAQKLTPAQTRAVVTLAAQLPKEHFDWDVIRDKANVPLFVELAAGPGPARVVAAALHALAEATAPEPVPEDKVAIPPDMRTVVLARLTAPHRLVQHEAFEATAPLLLAKSADEATLQALAKILREHKDPAVRYAAVRALRNVSLRGLGNSPGLPAPILTACADAEAVVRLQALSLLQLYGTSSGFNQAAGPGSVFKTLQTATRHADVATRLVATTSLANVVLILDEPERTEAINQFVKQLDDKHPALRAAGAMSLVRNQQPRAMTRLVALLDDQGSTELQVKGPVALDGEKVEMPVTAVMGEPRTVAHAAVQALMMLAMTGSDSFYCEGPHGEQARAMFDACLVKAKAWTTGQAGLKK